MAGGVSYLALLRGINVGGKNKVDMAELREAFEEMGHTEVSTWINSGNVFFRAPRGKRDELAARTEKALTKRFGIDLKVVLVTRAQLDTIVEGAPKEFGSDRYRCDVLFLRKPLTVKKAMAAIDLKEGVDQAWPGKGVVYFARLDAKASSSRISKFAMEPEYQDTTIRSWSSTQKLHARLD